MKAVVNNGRVNNKIIGQFWMTAAAKTNAMLCQIIINFLLPPAAMPEFNNIVEALVYTADKSLQHFFTILYLRGKLKKHSAQFSSQALLHNSVKIIQQLFCTVKFFIMGDNAGHFQGENKIARACRIPFLQRC